MEASAAVRAGNPSSFGDAAPCQAHGARRPASGAESAKRSAKSGYDALMAAGVERHEARQRVRDRVELVLADWQGAK
jgi:hypothetical protein